MYSSWSLLKCSVVLRVATYFFIHRVDHSTLKGGIWIIWKNHGQAYLYKKKILHTTMARNMEEKFI